MRHLYLRIYVAIILILIVFGLLVSAAWWIVPDNKDDHRVLQLIVSLVEAALPLDDSAAENLAALTDLSSRTGIEFTLRDDDGALIAATADPLPIPPQKRTGLTRLPKRGPVAALALSDGRWLVARDPKHDHPPHGVKFLIMLALLAAAVAVGAHPLAKRITRRLERLQLRVEALGAGDLSARVDVQGKDEVAQLARSFNRAAERIEQLVASQKSMLASASHELRSPLARIRMAIELLTTTERPELRERIANDITELDDLIDELSLASRLDSVESQTHTETVDVLALAAEEGARVNASVSGQSVLIRGNPRLLRRLARNLFENAARYGGGTAIEAEIDQLPSGAGRIIVMDRGPGIEPAERENIFRPFYRPAGMVESGGGVGLGLSLVRQIARSHRGSAVCTPRPGGGTHFEVVVFSLGPSD